MGGIRVDDWSIRIILPYCHEKTNLIHSHTPRWVYSQFSICKDLRKNHQCTNGAAGFCIRAA